MWTKPTKPCTLYGWQLNNMLREQAGLPVEYGPPKPAPEPSPEWLALWDQAAAALGLEHVH